jgi:aquaporin Z
MKKYLTEFIGTFFLVLTVVMVANNPGIGSMAPFAISGMYLAMIYAGGPISGGHYNPAVTLAVLMRRQISRGDALYYMIVQFISGILAAAIGVYLHDCGGGLEIVARVNEQPICTVMGEFLGTFALVYVFLNVTNAATSAQNAFSGLAIGFTVMASRYGLGGLSGGAFNPAIVLGASVAGMFGWDDFGVYLIGTILGAAAAATAIQLIHRKEEEM